MLIHEYLSIDGIDDAYDNAEGRGRVLVREIQQATDTTRHFTESWWQSWWLSLVGGDRAVGEYGELRECIRQLGGEPKVRENGRWADGVAPKYEGDDDTLSRGQRTAIGMLRRGEELGSQFLILLERASVTGHNMTRFPTINNRGKIAEARKGMAQRGEPSSNPRSCASVIRETHTAVLSELTGLTPEQVEHGGKLPRLL